MANPASTVTVDGTGVTSGDASGAISLSVGTTTITIEVTAENASTQSYTIAVTRAAAPIPLNSDSTLSTLVLSQGTLSPAFDPATDAYSATVGNSATAITVTPTVANSASTVTVDGTPVTSGDASGAINLSVGENTITVIVTAEDTSTQTYTILQLQERQHH